MDWYGSREGYLGCAVATGAGGGLGVWGTPAAGAALCVASFRGDGGDVLGGNAFSKMVASSFMAASCLSPRGANGAAGCGLLRAWARSEAALVAASAEEKCGMV